LFKSCNQRESEANVSKTTTLVGLRTQAQGFKSQEEHYALATPGCKVHFPAYEQVDQVLRMSPSNN